MDASMATADEVMEASVTGSTGGTSSMRTGKGAKSAAARMVASKFMQSAMAATPQTGHRPEISGSGACHLRAGASMGYASVHATPALHGGRSLHLGSTAVKASGMVPCRTITARETHYLTSPAPGNPTLSAASMAAPNALSFDSAAQERRKEQLAKYKQDKQEKAARALGGVAAPSLPGPNASSGAAVAPRVPALALNIFRDGGQASGDGSRSARLTGGMYNGGAGQGTVQPSARGGQLPSARTQAQARPAGTVPGIAGRASGGASGNTARAPPLPRVPVMPQPGMVEQQLRTAVNAPLPRDEVWEAAQVALPADGFEEAAAGPAVSKTPSSRITKSPRVVAAGSASGIWAPQGQMLPMHPPPPPPQQQQQHHYHQPAPVPPRSPPLPSSRAPAAAASTAGNAADVCGARAGMNAEASTSDTGGRSIKDQIKMAKLQELQFRALRIKLEAAARVKMDKGARQLAAISLLLTDMMAQSAANKATLEAAEALKRTQHVLSTQLPLLKRWKELQDTHGPATREVLTALQNALTSLPLVNGAALGGGACDGMQALPSLRNVIVKALHAMQASEAAMGILLHGVGGRCSGGGSAADARGGQSGQTGHGGVTAVAALLPKLHEQLVGEVANLRSLLTNLNTLACKMDEAACLRARSAAAELAARAPSQEQEQGSGGAWGEAAAAVLNDGGSGATDPSATIERALAMLGLGIGGS